MRCWRDQRGFTVTEMITACAMLGVALAAVTTIQHRTFEAYVVGSNNAEVQQKARVALERMSRDIRRATTGLTAATETSVTLTLPDPSNPSAGVQTTYALSDSNLTCTGVCDDQTVSATAITLIGGVQKLTFTYYLVDSPTALTVPVATPADVFRVDITIQTKSEHNVATGSVADTRAGLTTSVRVRNL